MTYATQKHRTKHTSTHSLTYIRTGILQAHTHVHTHITCEQTQKLVYHCHFTHTSVLHTHKSRTLVYYRPPHMRRSPTFAAVRHCLLLLATLLPICTTAFRVTSHPAPQSTSAAPPVGRAGLTYMPRLGRARMRQLRCDCIPRHASQRVAMGAQGMGEVAAARRLEMPAFEAWKQANKIKSPYVSHAMFAIGNSEQRGVVAGMDPLVVYVVREHAHMQLARECSFIHQPVKGHATGI